MRTAAAEVGEEVDIFSFFESAKSPQEDDVGGDGIVECLEAMAKSQSGERPAPVALFSARMAGGDRELCCARRGRANRGLCSLFSTVVSGETGDGRRGQEAEVMLSELRFSSLSFFFFLSDSPLVVQEIFNHAAPFRGLQLLPRPPPPLRLRPPLLRRGGQAQRPRDRSGPAGQVQGE